MPKATRVTLELDAEQLAILMGAVEAQFNVISERRSEETLDAQVEEAAAAWRIGADNDYRFNVLRIAPVYRQLLKHWREIGDENDGCIFDAVDIFEFVAVAKAAGAVITHPQRSRR